MEKELAAEALFVYYKSWRVDFCEANKQSIFLFVKTNAGFELCQTFTCVLNAANLHEAG